MPYGQALELLRGLAVARRAGGLGETLVLTSHPPVITLGRRGSREDLLLPLEQLAQRGIAVERVERGGLVTAHGPGQLMVYPVMSLPALGLGVAALVRSLETAGLQVCASLGVRARRREDHPGLWAAGRKIASLGLAVRRGVSLHGLALYRRPEPELFSLINPCGLSSAQITSLEEELAEPVEPGLLSDLMAASLARALNLAYRPVSLAQAWEIVRCHASEPAQAALA